MRTVALCVIGAGPTGLGAAIRWRELSGNSLVVLEATNQPGGLSASFRDPAGFTWDQGSHLQFSHYCYYDKILDRGLPPDQWLTHQRKTSIWFKGRFIPYPFQLHLHHLAPQDRWECIQGLLKRDLTSFNGGSFGQWCLSAFGETVTRLFMRPYNEKLWQCQLEEMSSDWIAERVATTSLEQVLEAICLERDVTPWGPNATFRYPLRGGAGKVWDCVAGLLPRDSIEYGMEARQIDVDHRIVTTQTGELIHYESLISTIPLPRIAEICGNPPGLSETGRLKSVATHVVGIGVEGKLPPSLAELCWSYFPQPEIPFYRMTVLSNLSPFAVPDAEKYWSIVVEVSEPQHSRFSKEELIAESVRVLTDLGYLQDDTKVVSCWHRRLSFGYPVPTVERDEILRRIHRYLEAKSIFSRGRFGAWMYEISNQDHSFMQGTEAVDRILLGSPEPTMTRLLHQRERSRS